MLKSLALALIISSPTNANEDPNRAIDLKIAKIGCLSSHSKLFIKVLDGDKTLKFYPRCLRPFKKEFLSSTGEQCKLYSKMCFNRSWSKMFLVCKGIEIVQEFECPEDDDWQIRG